VLDAPLNLLRPVLRVHFLVVRVNPVPLAVCPQLRVVALPVRLPVVVLLLPEEIPRCPLARARRCQPVVEVTVCGLGET
jgi:hypothetical protein